jgi:hypothetical protein
VFEKFIAGLTTDQDRHELIQLLRPLKPRVQSLYYRLIQLNGYVNYLPGNDYPLTEDQLKQSFHDGMPPTWKERFLTTGFAVRNVSPCKNNLIINPSSSQDFQALSNSSSREK